MDDIETENQFTGNVQSYHRKVEKADIELTINGKTLQWKGEVSNDVSDNEQLVIVHLNLETRQKRKGTKRRARLYNLADVSKTKRKLNFDEPPEHTVEIISDQEDVASEAPEAEADDEEPTET